MVSVKPVVVVVVIIIIIIIPIWLLWDITHVL